MRRTGCLIEQIAEMDNLLMAFYKAQKCKNAKAEVVRYREHLQDHLLRMRQQLLSGRVDVGHYHTFMIYDPKKRTICATAFDERVLQHALMRVCHCYFDRHLISDTYATRLGKGTYAALDRAHRAMARYRYVAKLDVRKYFDSVDHALLKAQLARLFKDPVLLSVFDQIIDSYQSDRPGCGLPMGNLTSQYFANHYLSAFDHFVKERLHVPCYIRYMDDMLLFGHDRAEVARWVEEVKSYLAARLHLQVKPPQIVSVGQGVSFLGYRLSAHRIGLNSRSRNRFRRKLNRYGLLLSSDVWGQNEYRAHVAPLMAFVQYAYSKRYRQSILKSQTARLEPRESGWQLEQQRQELPRVESQQQHAV